MSYSEVLKKSNAFSLLEEAECKAISVLAKEKKVTKGTILGKEGQKAEELFLVVDGELEVSINAALTEPLSVTIATIAPGHISGWSSMYADGILTATIKASRNSTLLVWKSSDLHEFLIRNCGMGYRILQQILAVVAQRLVNTRMGLTSCVMDHK